MGFNLFSYVWLMIFRSPASYNGRRGGRGGYLLILEKKLARSGRNETFIRRVLLIARCRDGVCRSNFPINNSLLGIDYEKLSDANNTRFGIWFQVGWSPLFQERRHRIIFRSSIELFGNCNFNRKRVRILVDSWKVSSGEFLSELN